MKTHIKVIVKNGTKLICTMLVDYLPENVNLYDYCVESLDECYQNYDIIIQQ